MVGVLALYNVHRQVNEINKSQNSPLGHLVFIPLMKYKVSNPTYLTGLAA
jgi:hypothetical protein